MNTATNKTDKQLRLSLVIPIFNEADHLEAFLKKIDLIDAGCLKELVFIDDRSTDSSLSILEKFIFQSEVKIIKQNENCGKGAAIRRGIEAAQGVIIGIQDADFEYDPTEIKSLVEPLLQDKADIVYGSRFKKNAPQVHRTFHYLINRILTLMSNAFSGLYLTDMETCYKFFRSDIIKNIRLESNRFGFEPEITAKISKLKVRVFELPISYFPRNYLEGKKITWVDGLAAVVHLFVFNFLRKPNDYLSAELPKKFRSKSAQWL